MGKKRKRTKGHYCWVCGSVKSNESFSGKGHRQHICKLCNKKSPEQRQEEGDLNKIFRILRYERANLSRHNKKMLEIFSTDSREMIRQTAKEVMTLFQSHSWTNEEPLDAELPKYDNVDNGQDIKDIPF